MGGEQGTFAGMKGIGLASKARRREDCLERVFSIACHRLSGRAGGDMSGKRY
jgi:hypothetical protein